MTREEAEKELNKANITFDASASDDDLRKKVQAHRDAHPSTMTRMKKFIQKSGKKIGTAMKVFKEWGWRWESPFVVCTHRGQALYLLRAPRSFCKQQYQDTARKQRWKVLRKQKRVVEGDMQDLQDIDVEATCAIWHGKVSKQLRHLVPRRRVMIGGFRRY